MSHFHIRVLISTADKQWKCESDTVPVDQLLSLLKYMSVYIQSTDDMHCKQYWQPKKADSSNLILLQRVDLILGPDPVMNQEP